MAYVKQTWASGDVITAQKLNHIEDGIANSGVLEVGLRTTPTQGDEQLDKTFGEIFNAVKAGEQIILVRNIDDQGQIQMTLELIYLISYHQDDPQSNFQGSVEGVFSNYGVQGDTLEELFEQYPYTSW